MVSTLPDGMVRCVAIGESPSFTLYSRRSPNGIRQRECEAWSKTEQGPSNIPAGPGKAYRKQPEHKQGYQAKLPRESSSSSSSTSATQKKAKAKTKTRKAKTKTKKTAAPQPPPPPPRGNTNGGPSRKRARAASGSESDSDDDTLGGSSSGPPQTKVKVEVEEIGGFSIVSSASDLKHTACGLLQQGAPTS